MKKQGITRKALPFQLIVKLYIYMQKNKTIIDAINNTNVNAKNIIRDPVNYTHTDDKYSTRQSRNHMYNCRDKYTLYIKEMTDIQNKFDTYYTENEKEYYFKLVRNFLNAKKEKIDIII